MSAWRAKRKKGSYHHKSTCGRMWSGGVGSRSVDTCPAKATESHFAGCSQRRAAQSEIQGVLDTAHARRAVSWTADAGVQYKDHSAANPEKLISVLTLLDRENPTVISNELQINFSQEFNTGSMTGKCHDCLALR